MQIKPLSNDWSYPVLSVASLGAASRITVTIAASDDAHGVFQFSPDSLSVNGTEPGDGHSTVVLQVSGQDIDTAQRTK